MTANGPYTQSFNYTHMFDFIDPNANCFKYARYRKNSLYGKLVETNTFSIFKRIVQQADMNNILDNEQANFTLFVPSDEYILKKYGINVFINLDKGTAVSIVKSSMLDKRITSELLQYSPMSYFFTKYPPNKLYISNVNFDMTINCSVKTLEKDIICDNGIIHVVDDFVNPQLQI